ncbi:MAG: C45 family autoproteolytic acyltransferase/hydrolase [Chloroflexota bacterium]|nr:C45 family autoproteolytic acyltransferase/hydrolase [Chloroflexota bacterium]
MRKVVLTGTPYDMGRQQGEAFADLVADAIQFVVPEGRYADAHKARVLGQVERNMERVFPEALAELHGIADGAGVRYDDLLAYNSCQELGRMQQACTNFVLVTPEHGIIHYKSNDVSREALKFHVYLEAHPDSGHDFIGVTWAGTVWMNSGINEAGLTYGGGSLPNTDSDWDHGLPANVVLRYFLQYPNDVDDALALVARTPIMSHGHNMVFTDPAGNGAVVERTPTAMGIRRLDDHAIWASNHCLVEDVKPMLRANNESFMANSHGRYGLLEKLTAEQPHSLNQVIAIARAHADPTSMCQHGPYMHTVIGYVMIPAERRMLIAYGRPCENEFEEYAFAAESAHVSSGV